MRSETSALGVKKILSIFILSLILSGFYAQNTTSANNSKTYFRVTAYYSPLPNQKYYIKGNYIAEKRMNGQWIRWASGKRVFSGMIAAPSNYRFWTKIYLKWLWVWEVADRGQAIVKAWERNFRHDRLDIWVGYGDEGLRRAMYWGNRVIKWKIVDSNSKVTIDYNDIPAPSWAVPKTKQTRPYIKNNTIIKNNIKKIQKTDFELSLEEKLQFFNSKIKNTDWVKSLQKKLKDLNLYFWKIDWNYMNIIKIITDYQIERNLIQFKWEIGTWNFWPKTRASLKKDYREFLVKKEKENKKIQEFERQINYLKTKSEKKANHTLKNIWNPRVGDISHWVRALQKTLNKLGYFEHKDTAIFATKTKQAILDYQLSKNIISNIYEIWAWNIWPNTKKQMLSDLAKLKFLDKIEKNIELSYYYNNKETKIVQIEKNKEM